MCSRHGKANKASTSMGTAATTASVHANRIHANISSINARPHVQRLAATCHVGKRDSGGMEITAAASGCTVPTSNGGLRCGIMSNTTLLNGRFEMRSHHCSGNKHVLPKV